MKLKVTSIVNPGDLPKERVVLKALEPLDLGRYIISDTTFIDSDHFSNALRHIYWFQSRIIDPGDLVVVYTKVGTDSKRKEESGRTTHFLYWGLGRTVWNEEQDCAVLLELANWQALGYKKP